MINMQIIRVIHYLALIINIFIRDKKYLHCVPHISLTFYNCFITLSDIQMHE